METEVLDEERRHEQPVRDDMARENAIRLQGERSVSDGDRMEMIPALATLQAGHKRQRILEFGEKTEQYTLPIAKAGASVLAIDFSFEPMRILARRIAADVRIGVSSRRCKEVWRSVEQIRSRPFDTCF